MPEDDDRIEYFTRVVTRITDEFETAAVDILTVGCFGVEIVGSMLTVQGIVWSYARISGHPIEHSFQVAIGYIDAVVVLIFVLFVAGLHFLKMGRALIEERSGNKVESFLEDADKDSCERDTLAD